MNENIQQRRRRIEVNEQKITVENYEQMVVQSDRPVLVGSEMCIRDRPPAWAGL